MFEKVGLCLGCARAQVDAVPRVALRDEDARSTKAPGGRGQRRRSPAPWGADAGALCMFEVAAGAGLGGMVLGP
jgi:hypothetical protein